jgi:hypothetical protein
MIVEHVTVEAGGQAIAGTVNGGAGGECSEKQRMHPMQSDAA